MDFFHNPVCFNHYSETGPELATISVPPPCIPGRHRPSFTLQACLGTKKGHLPVRTEGHRALKSLPPNTVTFWGTGGGV